MAQPSPLPTAPDGFAVGWARATRGVSQLHPDPAGEFRALAVVFFFIPLALWALGVQSPTTDNRALAPLPHSFSSWDVMDETAAYVNDHLPFRGSAVRLRAELSQRMFKEAPPSAGGNFGEAAPRAPVRKVERNFIKLPPAAPEPSIPGNADVMIGKSGWLYLNGEFESECNTTVAGRQVVIDGLRRLQSILARSGRRFVFTIAPDKSTADPAWLPDDNPFAECSPPAKLAAFHALASARIPGYIDIEKKIRVLQAKEARPYYLRQDTHWNGLAAAVFAQAAVRAVDPTLLDRTNVRERVESYVGDLTTLLGTPSSDRGVTTDIVRAGVRVKVHKVAAVPGSPPIVRSEATTTGAPLFPDDALIIGDSFSEVTLKQLQPFFRKLTWLHSTVAYTAPAMTAKEIAKAKFVIWLTVERYFTSSSLGVVWSKPFVDKLHATLPRHSSRRAGSP